MNKIVLLGKLIKDPELKTIENGEKSFTRFIIAVDRNFKSAAEVVAEDFKFVGSRRVDKESSDAISNEQ